MLLFIAFAAAAALYRGGRLSCAVRDFSLYPLYICELVYIFFVGCAYFENYSFVAFAQPLQAAFILLLILPILRHRLYKPAAAGCACVVAGSLLNRVVIAANGGKMPVLATLSRLTGYFKEGSLDGSVDSLHIAMSSSTALNFLGDWIDIGFAVMSPGDVLIHLFTSIVIYYSIICSTAKQTE